MENRKLDSNKRICSEVSVNSPGESVESVLKKKRKATVGRICCRKGSFQAWNEIVRGDRILIIISINVSKHDDLFSNRTTNEVLLMMNCVFIRRNS